jgi:hypothetical protein
MSKSIFSGSRRRDRRGWLLAAGAACAMLLTPQAGMAATGGVFAPFLGNWRGSGEVTFNDGHKERINCRTNYTASEGGGSLTNSLTCAGDSYRFQVSMYVEATGQNLLGHWEEATRQVGGQLTGQVDGGHFEGKVSGPTFSLQLSLNSTDRQQTMSIRPQGTSFTSVTMVLDRQR